MYRYFAFCPCRVARHRSLGIAGSELSAGTIKSSIKLRFHDLRHKGLGAIRESANDPVISGNLESKLLIKVHRNITGSHVHRRCLDLVSVPVWNVLDIAALP